MAIRRQLHMTGTKLLEQLLDSYQSSYDIAKPFDINGDVYDAYASFNVTSAKYVLIKKAELWRANCFEHTFFRCTDCLTPEQLADFRNHITDFIEPELIRNQKKYPEKNHMYSYITGIFLCENGLPEHIKNEVRRFRYTKNYLLGIRGYSQARLLVFDLKNLAICGNAAAKDLVKGYNKAGILRSV